MSWRNLQGFNELMLKNEHSPSDQVDFEDHLVSHTVNILCINFH
jgi:hypothetical protein